MHPTRFTVAPRFRPALSAREGEGRRARLPRDRRCTVPSVPSRSVPTPPPPQRGAAAPARAVTYMAGGVRVRPRCRPLAPVRSEVVGMNRTHRMQNKTKRKKKKEGGGSKRGVRKRAIKTDRATNGGKKKKKKNPEQRLGHVGVSCAKPAEPGLFQGPAPARPRRRAARLSARPCVCAGNGALVGASLCPAASVSDRGDPGSAHCAPRRPRCAGRFSRAGSQPGAQRWEAACCY